MAAPFRMFDVVLHLDDKEVVVCNIDPDKYSYFDLLEDVSDTVLSYLPASRGVTIKLFCDIPGSFERKAVENDKDVLDMFYLGGRIRTVNMFVYVEPTTKVVNVESSKVAEVVELSDDGEVDEGGNVEYDGDNDEEVEDDFYGFSDEDRDWNEDEENEEHVSDGETSLDEEEVTTDDDALSNYESDDNEGKYDNDNDATKDLTAPKALKSNYFDSSYFGKEPYFGPEGEVILEEKMLFNNVDSFGAALRDYIVRTGFEIVRDKNEKARVTAHCATKGYPWRIHASPIADGITYQIKTLRGEHNCSRIVKNSDATSPWNAKKLLSSFRENPNMGIETMQEKLADLYGIECSTSQLYRAKRKCMHEIEGKGSNQYRLLPTYAVEVRKTNPGSYFKIQCERPSLQVNPTFMRCFISFEAMQNGFIKGCRPFLAVDGTFLKGHYGGILLTAIALDGNNGLFPLAVVVVESECNDSWAFFMDHLKSIIGADQPKP